MLNYLKTDKQQRNTEGEGGMRDKHYKNCICCSVSLASILILLSFSFFVLNFVDFADFQAYFGHFSLVKSAKK